MINFFIIFSMTLNNKIFLGYISLFILLLFTCNIYFITEIINIKKLRRNITLFLSRDTQILYVILKYL